MSGKFTHEVLRNPNLLFLKQKKGFAAFYPSSQFMIVDDWDAIIMQTNTEIKSTW